MGTQGWKAARAPWGIALWTLAWVLGASPAWAGASAPADNKINVEMKGQSSNAKNKAKGPRVVEHPLTSWELLDQKDAEAFESLMEGARVFAKADPALAEQRAQAMLQEGKGAKTASPFIDWAHYAALALCELDPQEREDLKSAVVWAGYFDLLQHRARVSFKANEAGRAEAIADNALCAYRQSPAEAAACLSVAHIRANEVNPALDSTWPEWISMAAMGLAEQAGWPGKWDSGKERLGKAGVAPEGVAEVEFKLGRLDQWAAWLNPVPALMPFDALEQARGWAKARCWSPDGKKNGAPVADRGVFWGGCSGVPDPSQRAGSSLKQGERVW